jgi:hypothetical protein
VSVNIKSSGTLKQISFNEWMMTCGTTMTYFNFRVNFGQENCYSSVIFYFVYKEKRCQDTWSGSGIMRTYW